MSKRVRRIESQTRRSAEVVPERMISKLGNRVGPKGEQKRQDLMRALLELLETRNLWAISVSDVAFQAGSSQSNFYTYFDSVEEVLLALTEQAAREYPSLCEFIEADWSGPEGLRHAEELVAGALAFWKKWFRVMTLANLLADDFHHDFIMLRAQYMEEIADAFARKMKESYRQGHLPASMNVRLASYKACALLEECGERHKIYEGAGFSPATSIETVAALIHLMVMGRPAKSSRKSPQKRAPAVRASSRSKRTRGALK